MAVADPRVHKSQTRLALGHEENTRRVSRIVGRSECPLESPSLQVALAFKGSRYRQAYTAPVEKSPLRHWPQVRVSEFPRESLVERNEIIEPLVDRPVGSSVRHLRRAEQRQRQGDKKSNKRQGIDLNSSLRERSFLFSMNRSGREHVKGWPVEVRPWQSVSRK